MVSEVALGLIYPGESQSSSTLCGGGGGFLPPPKTNLMISGLQTSPSLTSGENRNLILSYLLLVPSLTQ